MTLSDLKKLIRKYVKVLPGGPAPEDITRGKGMIAVLDALAEEATAGADVVLYDEPGQGEDGAMTQKATTEALTLKGSQQVQEQHSEQLATLGVQGSPVYGYLDGTEEPVGYASLDEALADPRQKTFFRFNKSTIRLSASNNPASPGWAFAADGEGSTIEVGANVRLNVPGLNRDALTLEKFFVYQQEGTRGGRVKLLATNRDGVADGELPFWQGGCKVPLELSGGAIGLQGSFTSFIGTGTIHLYEPYSYGYVAPGITLVEHKPGAGGGGTGDAYSKAETDQKDAALQQQIDDINSNGGPVLQRFVFEPGYADSYTFTAGPDVVGVYGTEGLSNVSSATYYIGIAVTALPLTIKAGDKIRIDINRQTSTQVASVSLSK